jgi:Protein of unknown function (DUF2274)
LEEDLIDATNTPNTSAKVLKELKRAVKVTVEFPAPVHRDLLAYADYLNSQHVAFTEGGEAWRI